MYWKYINNFYKCIRILSATIHSSNVGFNIYRKIHTLLPSLQSISNILICNFEKKEKWTSNSTEVTFLLIIIFYTKYVFINAYACVCVCVQCVCNNILSKSILLRNNYWSSTVAETRDCESYSSLAICFFLYLLSLIIVIFINYFHQI